MTGLDEKFSYFDKTCHHLFEPAGCKRGDGQKRSRGEAHETALARCCCIVTWTALHEHLTCKDDAWKAKYDSAQEKAQRSDSWKTCE